MWQGNFRDMLTDRKANALVSDFVARKIRERVKDPKVAEKLIPKDHGFGTRRVPLETQLLRGLQPAQRAAGRHQGDADRAHHAARASGPATRSYAFDIIIYATGFDAITGSFDRIDIRGPDGRRLKDNWRAARRRISACRSRASPTC